MLPKLIRRSSRLAGWVCQHQFLCGEVSNPTGWSACITSKARPTSLRSFTSP